MLNIFLRRKIFLLFSFIVLFSAGCFAQHDPLFDSLLTVLKNTTDDTSKVNTLNALGRQCLRTYNIPDAKKYVMEALTLAEKKNFKKGVNDAHINSGNIYNTQGNIYAGQSNSSEALKNYFEALKIFEKYGSKNGIATAYTNIGRIYWIQRNYSEGLKNFSTALKVYEEAGNKNGIAGAYNNIGLIYENQGYYQEALKYYYDAIRLYSETGNKWAMIDRYFNIGFLYEDQGNYPEALKNHLSALNISEEIGSKEGIAASNSNIGGVYNNQENYPEALERYLLALKLYGETGNQEGVAISYTNAGGVYIDVGNYSLAKQYLDDALSLSKELGLIENIKTVYELMTKLDSTTGNWQGALVNHKLYIVYRDSLASDEITRKITKAQMQFDFDKKEDSLKYLQVLTDEKLKQQTLRTQQQKQTLLITEKELALVNSEKHLQLLQMQKDSIELVGQKAVAEKKEEELELLTKEKAIRILELNKQKQLKKYLLTGLALFLVLSFFIYRNYRSRQQLKLQVLRNKIASDLHDDVGSTLSSISIFSQMAQQQSKEVVPLLETIGESSRKMLDAMADIVWTINPENDQFEKIVLRMKNFAYELLGAKNIDFEFFSDDDVAKMKLPMNVRKNLYLIFKEATNNMVKYSGADKALFTIRGEKNNLTLQIRDNGKGFDINRPAPGNGLRNMRKRADEIRAQFVIDSIPGQGTTVQLSLLI